mmetsp:Transcript_58505/g.116006  ORF Transcript_58505/g.116006 Transcript_58505/m.116006 type:complete len:692 (+) Transcript_58505:64-2139(+)
MSASISGVEALPFLDVEQEVVEASSHTEDSRLSRRTWTALRILGGVAALTMVVLATLHPTGRLTSAQEADATIQAVAVTKGTKKDHKKEKKEPGAPFTQCGGANYKGKTCCQNGCACIKDDKYYSQCKPPSDLQKCDVGASKVEVKHAKSREKTAQTELQHALANVVKAKKDAKNAVSVLKAARKEEAKATKAWKTKDNEEKKQVEAAKNDQSEVFDSAESDRKKSVKSAKDEREKTETAAKDKLAQVKKTAKANQDQVVTKAKEKRDKLVKDAKDTKKTNLNKAHKEMKSVEEDSKKKAAAQKEAATKERKKTITDAAAARDKAIKDAKAEWTASDNKATAAKAKTAKALKEAKEASEAASAALKKQASELGNVSDWVTFYKKQEEMRKTKKCSTMWKDCKAVGCCSLGCKCHWQSKYFASCTGIFGSKNYCEKDKAIAKQTESLQVLPGLQMEHKNLKEDAENKAKVRDDAQQKMDALDTKWASTLGLANKKETDTIAKARETYKEAEDSAVKREEELLRDINQTATDAISKERKKSKIAIQRAKNLAADVIATERKKAKQTITDVWEYTNTTIKDATEQMKTSIAASKNREKRLIEAALKKEKDATSDAMAKIKKATAVAHKATQDADDVRKRRADHAHKKKMEAEATLTHLKRTKQILNNKRHKHAMAKLEVQTWVRAKTGAMSCKH